MMHRTGAFECYPELTSYIGLKIPGTQPPRALLHDADDSQPPTVSYTATQSDMESEEEEEGEGSLDYLTGQMDWEHLEPSLEETRLFEEEQMKQVLSAAVSSDREELVYRHAQEVEIYRQKLRRLDYNSTYRDYATMIAASSGSASSDDVHMTPTNSMGSVGGEEKSQDNVPTASPLQPLASGIFGTLSSLWTSTFGGGKS